MFTGMPMSCELCELCDRGGERACLRAQGESRCSAASVCVAERVLTLMGESVCFDGILCVSWACICNVRSP